MTSDRARPAAYIRAPRGEQDLARLRDAVAEGAADRGWPPPQLYLDDDPDLPAGHGPALARLEAAIEAGRHDALLITEPGAVTGTATHMMPLLARCTRNGVVAGFLLPPALVGAPASPAHPPAADSAAIAGPLSGHDICVLARARLEALSGLFPDWRIWLDHAGWHARRREASWVQPCAKGTPVYSVHANTPAALAAQLCWQQAADRHTPDGCPSPAARGPART